MYSYGPPHMAGQKQDDQLENTFSSYVRIQDVALKTYYRRWTIGRSDERGSGISVLVSWHNDDDDLLICVLYASGFGNHVHYEFIFKSIFLCSSFKRLFKHVKILWDSLLIITWYDLVWVGFMAYQPLLGIKYQILFIYTYQIYMIWISWLLCYCQILFIHIY